MNAEQGIYRIGAVARMTGVSTHALRAWERRYPNLDPIRTDSGLRLYSERQVERVRLIHRLLDQGHAIGTLAPLGSAALQRMLDREAPSVPVQLPVVDHVDAGAAASFAPRFLHAVLARDEDTAQRLLGQALLAFAPADLVARVLVPLLTEVGARWHDGSLLVAEEHAVSAILRSQLGTALRGYHPLPGAGTVLATTPAGEWHELGALLAALLAAAHGWRVEYLGPNLPAEAIAQAAVKRQAEAVLLSVIALDRPVAAAEIAATRALLPESVRLLVGGTALSPWPGVQILTRLEALPEALGQPLRSR